MQYNSPCQWLCGNVMCVQFGCQRAKSMPVTVQPVGCICPPTSEKTCQNPTCPRKPIRSTMSSRSGE